jgi:hypothetical protein
MCPFLSGHKGSEKPLRNQVTDSWCRQMKACLKIWPKVCDLIVRMVQGIEVPWS